MGRPRSEEARQAALTATVDLVLEHGIEGVTFEEVAERSGVAKTTLYRHFGTKQKMVVEAAFSCFVEHPTPDTGSLDSDLMVLFDKGQSTDEQQRVPDIQRALLAAGDRDTELRDLATAMGQERQRPIRTVLQLAQLRGEIGRDVDLDVAVAMIFGPFVMRRMVDRKEVTPEFRDAVLRRVVSSLRSTADAPAPV